MTRLKEGFLTHLTVREVLDSPINGKVCPEFHHLLPDFGVLVVEGEQAGREKVDQVVTVRHTCKVYLI